MPVSRTPLRARGRQCLALLLMAALAAKAQEPVDIELSLAVSGTDETTLQPVHARATWSGEGRGCGTLTGTATIHTVRYDATGALAAIDMDFEQHCEGSADALRGQIHWTTADNTVADGPLNPLPAGLWAPAAGDTPASGSFFYIESEQGDYIGGGGAYTYTRGNAILGVTLTGAHLSVSVQGDQSWSADFEGMNAISQLKPGYYGSLRRFPFHNPVRGGLSVTGNSRGCKDRKSVV